MLTNYHTHCDFCDGKASAATMASAAKEAGFSILGFSSHAPLPFSNGCNMDLGRLPEYIDTVRSLARHHAPGMTVLAGLEIDYIEGLCGATDGRFAPFGLDYALGSAHYVRPRGVEPQGFATAEPKGFAPAEPQGFAVDEPQADFDAHLASVYGGDAEALVDDYYAAVAAMARAGGFDMLGHLDLVRKNNGGQRWFSETSERYRAAAMKAVEAIAGTGIIVEINTGGMARGKTDSPYPAVWILRELRARGVEVCINADAHAPGHLSAYRDAGVRAARDAGYETLTILTKEGRRSVPVA